mmetsp:Transcript_78288/g.217431  ORF Transcript_78288/g.217431 Transcript_78288/m.217431 type:complete len:223 (-) Transcript_78288:436-1104(-)
MSWVPKRNLSALISTKSFDITRAVAEVFTSPASSSRSSFVRPCRSTKSRRSAFRTAVLASDTARTFLGSRCPGKYRGFSRVELMMSVSFFPPTNSSSRQNVSSLSKTALRSNVCPTIRATAVPQEPAPKHTTLSAGPAVTGGRGTIAWSARSASVSVRKSVTTPAGSSRFVGMMKCATVFVFGMALPMAQATRTDCNISKSFSESPIAHVCASVNPKPLSRT